TRFTSQRCFILNPDDDPLSKRSSYFHGILCHMLAVSALACALMISGCAEQPRGEGIYEIRIFGEAFAESGIPANAFVDGWSVDFAQVVVTLTEVVLHGEASGEITALPESRRFDLTQSSGGLGHLVAEPIVAGDRFESL